MIIRKIDELGRIVIPKEMRKELNLKTRDLIEIELEEREIVLRKHEDRCIFCGSNKNITNFRNKKICNKCLEDIRK